VSITTDLDAIRYRAAEATEGPWEADGSEVYSVATGRAWVAETLKDPSVQAEADATFIAHAREDVLFLLDLVDELRRQVKVWKGKAE
jgi:hypothetical protein